MRGATRQDALAARRSGAGGRPALDRARIENIERTVLAFPLARPFRAAIRLIESVDILLVRVACADGIAGCGYAFAFGAADLAAIAASARGLCPLLVGEDAVQVERHSATMFRALALLGAGGPALAALAALSAIDIAVWDVAGQVAGLPLCDMLGGARDCIPVYGSGGSLQLDTEELVAEAAGFTALGYPAYKFKLGDDLAQNLERLGAVRRAVGPARKLIVDANQQWKPKEALRVAHAIAPLDVWWLEEPVNAQNVAGCAEVRQRAPMHIATGETNFGIGECARLLEQRAADVLMPNLQRVGGITGWRKVAAMAELHGIPMASQVYSEIGAPDVRRAQRAHAGGRAVVAGAVQADVADRRRLGPCAGAAGSRARARHGAGRGAPCALAIQEQKGSQ